jgi:hypothetical protein
VFKILQEAKKLDLKRTEFKCYSFIEANPKVCKDSQDFQSLDRSLLSDIIKICKLGEQAKDGVLRWAKQSLINKGQEISQENMQQELGDLMSWLKISDSTREIKKHPLVPKRAQDNATNAANRVRMNRSSSTSSTSSSKMHLPKFLNFPGTMIYKTFKEAVLRISTGHKIVFIQEIDFCCNIAALDQEFEIWISFIHNNKRKDLFYHKMILKKTTEPFNRFVIPNGCKLLGGIRDYMIKIEFPEVKKRMTLENVGDDSNSENAWNLKIAPAVDQEVNIIRKIVYT